MIIFLIINCNKTELKESEAYRMKARTPNPQMSAVTPTFSFATFSGAEKHQQSTHSVNVNYQNKLQQHLVY